MTTISCSAGLRSGQDQDAECKAKKKRLVTEQKAGFTVDQQVSAKPYESVNRSEAKIITISMQGPLSLTCTQLHPASPRVLGGARTAPCHIPEMFAPNRHQSTPTKPQRWRERCIDEAVSCMQWTVLFCTGTTRSCHRLGQADVTIDTAVPIAIPSLALQLNHAYPSCVEQRVDRSEHHHRQKGTTVIASYP